MGSNGDTRVATAYERIVKQVAHSAGRTDWLLKACGIISGIVLPTVLGFVFAFWQKLFVSFDVFVWVALALIVVQGGLGLLTTLNLVNISHFHGAAAEMKQAYDALKDEYRDQRSSVAFVLGQTVAYTDNMLSALPVYREEVARDHTTFNEAIAELMDFFVENRRELFGVERGDLWNFAVFCHHRERDLLLPVWRKAAPSLWDDQRPRAMRAFGLCDGHVGAAFRRGEAIITENANDPAIRSFSEPPVWLRRDDDVARYVSFASFPLESGNHQPNGVLVATNSRIGTFTPQNCLALRSAAHLISRLAEELNDAKIEDIVLPCLSRLPEETG